MKALLIFPPQWTPLSPHFALTSLSPQLSRYGHDVGVSDLNIEFYRHILTSDYILKSIDKLAKQENQIREFIKSEFSPDKKEEEYSLEFKINAKKLIKINEIIQSKGKDLDIILKALPNALKIFTSKDDFYSLELFSKALSVIDNALNIISIPYYPAEFTLHDFTSPTFQFTYDEIKKYCFNKDINIFYDYFSTLIPNLTENNWDYIGISVGSYSQVVAGLTLAHLLKSSSNSHINIGGNYFGRVTDAFFDNPEFFEIFADSVIIEEGERPVVELADYLENKITIEEVSSLIYLKDGQVKINEKKEPLKLNDMPVQDLSGFKLNRYLMPEIVLPIQASRGCYWKKCTFCDHDFGQTYNVKNIDNLISEIQEIKDKFGISHFEFVDEAISAGYLEKFSKAVIEAGLEINWYCNARLESSLTKEILQLARKAGLRMILWGFESGSKRIMELINKGIDVDNRLEILKNATEADIWNFAYIFFGFPGETKEEAMETVNVVCDNPDLIPAYGRSVFCLGKHALINEDPGKFGIINLNRNSEEFSSNCSYDITSGLNSRELDELIEYFTQRTMNEQDNPAWLFIRYRETLFLYICKYGATAVKNMKSK